jgi:PAS domain S-box-containing protein
MDRPDLLVRIAELEAQVARLEHDRGELGEGAILRALMDGIAKRLAIEDDLRRANEWLHLAQEAGRVAAYAFDFREQKLDWSPSTKTLYGFPTDQDATLVGWLAAVHPDDRDAVEAVAQRAISEGRDVDHRFRIVRGDGEIFWIQDRARVHLAADGSPERLVGINVDVTELVNLERRSAENEQRLRLALKAERIACWDWDLVTGAVLWDETLPRLAGLADEDFGGDFSAFWDLVHEEDRPTVRAALDAAFAGEREYDVSFRMVRPDGSIRHTQTRAIILRDDTGKPLRMVGVDSDITDRFAADEQLRLFNGELHHRLKNNLATVQAMVRTTLRNSPDMPTFEKTFTQRLEALGVTYDLLRTGGDTASLAELVRAEVAPYAGSERSLIVDGPDVVLNSARAVAVGMIMHELTTNACKYGCLSVPGGELEVRWSIEPSPTGEQLVIEWTEQGGPPVARPAHRGFGSKLLERLVSRQLNGSFSRHWDSGGLKLRILCSLP